MPVLTLQVLAAKNRQGGRFAEGLWGNVMEGKRVTTRSVEFIAYFQLEAICRHLRNLVLNGIEPGPETRGVLKSLRDELVGR